VALATLAGTAIAADLPSRRAPPVYIPPPIPVFTWTGIYVGGQVGYEFGKLSSFASATATGAGLASASSSPKGVIGGAHIGYNYQIGPNFVVGVEGDVDGTSTKAAYGFNPFLSANYKQGVMGSVRGRVGYAVDRALFYATGGVAFGGVKNIYFNLPGAVDSDSQTRVGYTAGGGVEYAFTNNWSLRVEYRYTDFGSYTDVLSNTTGGGVKVHHKDTDNRVQAGFSYKFDSPLAPVVARY
jgi:outer membrane immunogenic protein